MRRIITATLTEAAIDYFTHKMYGVYTEVGLVKRGKLRADLIAINTKGKIIGVEIKSSWADFRADKKHHNYVKYFDYYYMVFSRDCYYEDGFTYHKELREIGCGIFILGRTGFLTSVKKARKQEGLSDEDRYKLMLKLAWRGATYSRRNRPRRTRRYLDNGGKGVR